MAGYTPGPWFAIDRSPEKGLDIRGGSHHYPIAQCKSYWDGPGPRSAEAHANQDLIATAPEMFEILSELLAKDDAANDGGFLSSKQAMSIRAVLAKATST